MKLIWSATHVPLVEKLIWMDGVDSNGKPTFAELREQEFQEEE
jgi:thymidylate kinase